MVDESDPLLRSKQRCALRPIADAIWPDRFGPDVGSVKASRPSLEYVFFRHAGRGFEPDGAAPAASPRSLAPDASDSIVAQIVSG